MSDETLASQTPQDAPGVEVQDPIPSGGAEPGPVEQAGTVPAAQEDPQPPQSQDAQGPADAAASRHQTPEGSSEAVPAEGRGEGTSTVAPNDGATVAPDTAAQGAAVAPEASPFTARQVGAARKFGLAEEDLVVLEAMGSGGRGLLDRLLKADSELGRRFSRLGRAEQTHGATGETPVVPQTSVASEAPSAEEVERLRAQVAGLQREAQEAEARRQDLLRQVRLRSEGLLARPLQRRGGGELESPADRTARALEEWQSRKGIQFFQQ